MTSHEQDLFQRFKSSNPREQTRAFTELAEEYEGLLHTRAAKHRLSEEDIEEVIQDAWAALARRTEAPDSVRAWLFDLVDKRCIDRVRKHERDAKRLEGKKEQARARDPLRTKATSGTSTKADADSRARKRSDEPAAPAARPLFLVPDASVESFRQAVPGAEVRAWGVVNDGSSRALQDILNFSPIIVGPAFDAVAPASNNGRFPVSLRALEEAARQGRSFILLLPPLGHIEEHPEGRWRSDLHVTAQQLFGSLVEFESHEFSGNGPVHSDTSLVGEEWGPPLQAWLATMGEPRHPRELSLVAGKGWSLQRLMHRQGSDHALIGLAEGPSTHPRRALILPLGPRLACNFPALHRFIDLLAAMPRILPLRADLAGETGCHGNSFDPGSGEPWKLNPEKCAVLWAYLQLARWPGDRVEEKALGHKWKEAGYKKDADSIGLLINAVNKSFEAFCREREHRPYKLLIREEKTVRLRFPGQFPVVRRADFTAVPKPRKKRARGASVRAH